MTRLLGHFVVAVIWALAALFALMLAIALLFILDLPFFRILGPIMLIPVGFIVIQLIGSIRRRREAVAMAYIRQAVRLNLPLAPMVRAAAKAEGRVLRRRLNQLADHLEAGCDLDRALTQSLPEASARTVGMMGAAQRLGRLPQALDRLLLTQQRAIGQDRGAGFFYKAYPLTLLMVVAWVVNLLMVFVMPKFKQIMRDFRVPLPTVTQAVIDFFGESELWLALVGLLALAVLGSVLLNAINPRWRRTSFWGAFIDAVAWRLPLWHGLERDRGMADLCALLDDALRAGVPLPEALGEATQLRLNVVLRRRVERWAQFVAEGQPPHEAARRAGLPALVGGLLVTAQAGHNATDVFRFLQRYYDAKFSRALFLLRGAAVPATALAMGIVVAMVALSLFHPIVALIRRPSGRR
jgi:type II secretory pathway component PulF